MTDLIPDAEALANAHVPIEGDVRAWVYGCGPDRLCQTSKQCVAAGRCLREEKPA